MCLTIFAVGIQVARSTEKSDGDKADYAGNAGAKIQTEWLPVEGAIPQLFAHLIWSMEASLLQT